jgi:hypothetical protein
MKEMGKKEAEIWYKNALNEKYEAYTKTMKNVKD